MRRLEKKSLLENNICVKKIYIIISLLCGMLMLFINPPLQTPDEGAHLIRTYQISQGNFISKLNDKHETIIDVPRNLAKPMQEKVNKNLKEPSIEKYSLTEMIEWLNIPLNKNETIKSSPGAAAQYSPLPYVPQAIGLKLAILMNLSPLICIYFARLFNLLLSTYIFSKAFELLPNHRILLFLIGCLPMLLYEAASLSADALTNASCVFVVAYFYHQAQLSAIKKITTKEIFFMFFLAFVLGMIKQTYIPLLLTYFLIPASRFCNKKQYFFIGIALLAVAVSVSLLWIKISLGGQVLLSLNGAIPKLQTRFIVRHPLEFMKVLNATISNDGLLTFLSISLVGYFGWLRIPLSLGLSLLYLLLLYSTGLFTKNEMNLRKRQRIILIAVSLMVIVSIFAALYITWTKPEAKVIVGVQGRYLIPALLPLLLACSVNKEINFVNITAVLIAIFSLAISLTRIYSYFYY